MKRPTDILKACTLCPRKCGINRLENETGHCKTGQKAIICSFHPHFGEEPELVGTYGSGTIFFSYCNLLCNFCQNFEISHLGEGRDVTEKELAGIMLELQQMGCHNINLVTPTHVVPQIITALEIAHKNGLTVPIVYNSGGYDRVSTLKFMEGLIDIYMPDFKFWSSEVAEKTCNAPDYPEVARKAIMEMHRQVGNLQTNSAGIAQKGLLIRHLVLPENLAGTGEICEFISKNISPDTYVNIMPQYRPCGLAHQIEGLDRRLTAKEYLDAIKIAGDQGLTRIHRC
jgi:putative pyruvate formate lyase activating enzyme